MEILQYVIVTPCVIFIIHITEWLVAPAKEKGNSYIKKKYTRSYSTDLNPFCIIHIKQKLIETMHKNAWHDKKIFIKALDCFL